MRKLTRNDLVFPFEASMVRITVKELRLRNYRAFADAQLIVGDTACLPGVANPAFFRYPSGLARGLSWHKIILAIYNLRRLGILRNEQPCSGVPWSSCVNRAQPGLQPRSVQFAATERPPVGEQAFHDLQTYPANCFSGSSSVNQFLKVAFQVGQEDWRMSSGSLL